MKSRNSINYKIKNYLIPQVETKSESFAHKVIKQLFYKKILENNTNLVEVSLEKHFASRRADVYFKFTTGQEVVVEIQNSPITSREITTRTKDYNNRGIYVLWVLYGDGKCVGSPKNPEKRKNLKISPAEMRLHQLYRGRVYYVNLKYQEEKMKATLPFALHFSYSDKISPILFKKGFDSFFIRNTNATYIPNWNLLCTTYGNYKVARFYDRSLNNTVMGILRDFSIRNNIFCDKGFRKSKKTKKSFKLVYNLFQDEFSKSTLIYALLRLRADKKLYLNEKALRKHEKKLKRRLTSNFNKN
ncbi:MAG: competence protein CoiA family protein [Candidatus Thorarchaeota archaeon]